MTTEESLNWAPVFAMIEAAKPNVKYPILMMQNPDGTWRPFTQEERKACLREEGEL